MQPLHRVLTQKIVTRTPKHPDTRDQKTSSTTNLEDPQPSTAAGSDDSLVSKQVTRSGRNLKPAERLEIEM